MFSFLNTNNIISFLILIFPAALVSGPLIPEIINFFFLLYLLYLLYNNEDLKIIKPVYIKFFILVNFYLLINSIISYINFGNEIVFKYSVFFFLDMDY